MKAEQMVESIEIVEHCAAVRGGYAREQARWAVVREYQMPFGPDYLRYKHGWGERFSLGALREYKRFVFLALSSDVEITPSVAVDEVWHLHILHTRAYEQFSLKVGKFLHHNPGMPTQRVKWDTQYDYTFERYREAFGEETPVQLWPRRSHPEPTVQEVLTRYRSAILEGRGVGPV